MPQIHPKLVSTPGIQGKRMRPGIEGHQMIAAPVSREIRGRFLPIKEGLFRLVGF
jgi:hypothetical protein